MTEREPGSDPEYVPMSPLIRYYNDINLVREDRSSAILALIDLADSLPLDSDTSLGKLLNSEYMPFEWEMENDIVIAKEKLAMLPIHALSADLEKSDFDSDRLKVWYNESLRGIRLIARDIHTNDCLKHTQPGHKMCDYSTTCPRRFSQQFLLHPAIKPDFSKEAYKVSPKREFVNIQNKLDLAMVHDFIEFDPCEDIRQNYITKYNTFMNNRSLSAPDKIV